MPPKAVRSPADKPEILVTDRVEFKLVQKNKGRPKKLGKPPMPVFKMTEDEAVLFDYIIAAFQEDYPNMSNSDLLFLPFIAADYIKYMRQVGRELETGELITMSRQSPASTLIRFMSQVLATTRQQRVKNEKPEEDDKDAFWNNWSVKAG